MKIRFLWRAFKTRFRDSRVEMQVLRKFIQPTDTVCDIGANKGSFTYWLAKWTARGKVVAFEPQAQLADYLKSATQAAGLRNVTVEAKAVSSTSGLARFFIPGDSTSPGASLNSTVSGQQSCQETEVEVIRLDDYFPSGTPVRALKIDVEGAELELFRGAERLISENQPLLVFECEIRHRLNDNIFETFQYLNDRGYTGYFVTKTKLMPISEFRPEVHQKREGERFWDQPDYINNFVFYPNGVRPAA